MAAAQKEGPAVILALKNIRLPLADFGLEINLELSGRVVALFGPSGAGKTSLLELVAGLRRGGSGCIQLDGVTLTDTSTGVFVPPRRRAIGYVPQDLALFPHLSVRHNLLYGHRGAGDRDPAFRFERVVEVLELGPLVRRSIGELSGGERQRVALGRALLASPKLLLLDEPLASLDAKLKARVLPYLVRIRDEFGVPMLYVTHDRLETLTLADQMAVILRGKVVQNGRVAEVFSRPAHVEVAELVTVETVWPGRVLQVANNLVTVQVGQAKLTAAEQFPVKESAEVHVCIRAEDVMLLKGADTPSSPRNHLPSIVREITNAGVLARVDLDAGFPLIAWLTRQACEELDLKPGDRVTALVKAPNVHLIPR